MCDKHHPELDRRTLLTTGFVAGATAGAVTVLLPGATPGALAQTAPRQAPRTTGVGLSASSQAGCATDEATTMKIIKVGRRPLRKLHGR